MQPATHSFWGTLGAWLAGIGFVAMLGWFGWEIKQAKPSPTEDTLYECDSCGSYVPKRYHFWDASVCRNCYENRLKLLNRK